jgi:DeoR/GlpR family transcriptional regulator of sugar metabolism
MNPRHEDILSILSLRRRQSVRELTDRLGVSEVTVRKDLGMLEDMGFLQRTRGGAVLAEDRTVKRSMRQRRGELEAEKESVAEEAARLVPEGATIYIDAGSACARLAERLREMSLRVVTNSVDVVLSLGDTEGIALHSLGGSYRKEAGSFIGPLAAEAVRRFRFDIAFMGTTGISESGEFTCRNLIEAELKRTAIERAERVVILADHSKLGVTAFSVFAESAAVGVLVLDEDAAGHPVLAGLDSEVILAPAARRR